jgi:hut operon positive regulatory protein
MGEFTSLGRTALSIAMTVGGDAEALAHVARGRGFAVATGKVGSMDVQKIIAAVETAAKREGIIDDSYRSQHALYHAIIDALQGMGRGPLELGNILRTLGMRFAIVKGPRIPGDTEGTWLAVGMYGMIGAPIKGHEHEFCGLGINHL